MNLTERDREFLEAVARNSLPKRYLVSDGMGSLHRAANRLIRAGLLEMPERPGGWEHYSLTTAGRLEALRAAIRAESISYGELAELQALAPYIEGGDTELAEWAGIPEGEFRER